MVSAQSEYSAGWHFLHLLGPTKCTLPGGGNLDGFACMAIGATRCWAGGVSDRGAAHASSQHTLATAAPTRKLGLLFCCIKPLDHNQRVLPVGVIGVLDVMNDKSVFRVEIDRHCVRSPHLQDHLPNPARGESLEC